MTTMNQNQAAQDIISELMESNPQGFLDAIYLIDQLKAVRIADQWRDPAMATHEQHAAAWSIVLRQDVAPSCMDCYWPDIGESHKSCYIEAPYDNLEDDLEWDGVASIGEYDRMTRDLEDAFGLDWVEFWENDLVPMRSARPLGDYWHYA